MRVHELLCCLEVEYSWCKYLGVVLGAVGETDFACGKEGRECRSPVAFSIKPRGVDAFTLLFRPALSTAEACGAGRGWSSRTWEEVVASVSTWASPPMRACAFYLQSSTQEMDSCASNSQRLDDVTNHTTNQVLRTKELQAFLKKRIRWQWKHRLHQSYIKEGKGTIWPFWRLTAFLSSIKGICLLIKFGFKTWLWNLK